MRTLIVYYSMEGNTDYTAKRIAENIGADLLRLFPVKAYRDKGFAKFLSGGRSAIMGQKPKLEKYRIDLKRYDRIVIGFPVWASRFAPPIRTFVEQNREELKKKELVAFACQGGSGAEGALAGLRKCIGVNAFALEAVFIEPRKKPSLQTDREIDTFSKLMADKDEAKKGNAGSTKRERMRKHLTHWNYKKHAKLCAMVYLPLIAFDMTVSYVIFKKVLDRVDERNQEV